MFVDLLEWMALAITVFVVCWYAGRAILVRNIRCAFFGHDWYLRPDKRHGYVHYWRCKRCEQSTESTAWDGLDN